ncbi:hypothetical protein PENTCL1PPCAC_12549, partial [Pristionchus entomophagus]
SFDLLLKFFDAGIQIMSVTNNLSSEISNEEFDTFLDVCCTIVHVAEIRTLTQVLKKTVLEEGRYKRKDDDQHGRNVTVTPFSQNRRFSNIVIEFNRDKIKLCSPKIRSSRFLSSNHIETRSKTNYMVLRNDLRPMRKQANQGESVTN